VVKQDHVCGRRSHHSSNLVEFLLPHQSRCIRLRTALHQRCRNLGACAPRQFFELRKRGVEIQIAKHGANF